jgi:hypothetical protein
MVAFRLRHTDKDTIITQDTGCLVVSFSRSLVVGFSREKTISFRLPKLERKSVR